MAVRHPRSLAALLHDGSVDAMAAMLESKALVRHAEPTMYMHRHVRAGDRCTGVVALVEARSFVDGSIRPHRRSGAEAPVTHAQAQVDSVIVGFPDDETVSDLMEREVNDRPHFHVVADDGATHTFWSGTRASAVAEAFARLPGGVVLEGHGRLPRGPSDAPVLALLLPLSQVRVRSSVAVVTGATAAALQERLQALPAMDGEMAEPPPGSMDAMWRLADGSVAWRRVQLPAPQRGAVTAEAVAHGRLEHLLRNWLDRAPELAWRPGLNWGPGTAPSTGELFLQPPRPSTDEVLQLAADGTPLPAGSTWMEPRIRSGLWMAERSGVATTIAE